MTVSSLSYIKVFSSSCSGNVDSVFDVPKMTAHVPRKASNNLNQVKKWLHDCVKSHEACSTWLSATKSQSVRPTRLIELMHDDDGIRLQCNVEAIRDIEYLALSHMWGTDPSDQLRLTMARFEEFQTSIAEIELPAMFKDAIRITRQLGCRHIWIDSLCIVQDSPSDWLWEASRMADIYNNALCTIAFVFPAGKGFSNNRPDPRLSCPCIIRQPNESGRGVYAMPDESDSVHSLRSEAWPWSTRAWVSQYYPVS